MAGRRNGYSGNFSKVSNTSIWYHTSLQGILQRFKKSTPIINDKLIESIMYTIPVSSSEAEKCISQMSHVCSPIRSKLTVLHMSSLLLNGTPSHLCNADSSVSSWLLSHRYATDTRSKKAKLASLADLNSVQRIFT